MTTRMTTLNGNEKRTLKIKVQLEEIQDAGKFIKVRGEPKRTEDGMLEFFLRVTPPVEEDPMIGLGEDYIGMFLVNDVSRDLIQIDRQRKGLERLKELEADNTVYEWLFDIKKAESNLVTTELEYPKLSPMNEEQELAVRGALGAKDVFLIQGPPGTGKQQSFLKLSIKRLKKVNVFY